MDVAAATPLLKKGDTLMNKNARKFKVCGITKNNFNIVIYQLEPMDNGKKKVLINNKIFLEEYTKL